ncbi:MAG: PQQ-binding-like beta-propeller repeat protein [Acidobacteriota bacterium]
MTAAAEGGARAPLAAGLLLCLAFALPASGQWSQYRGDGTGRSQETGFPVTWSERENVAWKTPLPGRGYSSPMVTAGRVWMTTALDDARSLRLLGVDALTGELLHDLEVTKPEAWQPGHLENSYASPTPATEVGLVCVHFGTYGTGCYDTGEDGRGEPKLLWLRRFEQEHEVGPGSSPILWQDLLIVNCDGVDTQFVLALDKRTGEEVWRAERHGMEVRKGPHRKAFSTPFIFRWGSRSLLLSTGATHTSAYDARTGEEIWYVSHEGYSNVPMPMIGLGLAFVNSGFVRPEMLAVRLGGEGDVTETHVRYTYAWQVPSSPSPLLLGRSIFMVNERGNATWLDAFAGKEVWRQRLKGRLHASPLEAEGRIFVFRIDGTTLVLRAAGVFEQLAENSLEGEIRATPALADGSIFIRTDSHLYRLSQKDGGSPPSEEPAPGGAPASAGDRP